MPGEAAAQVVRNSTPEENWMPRGEFVIFVCLKIMSMAESMTGLPGSSSVLLVESLRAPSTAGGQLKGGFALEALLGGVE